MAAAREQTVDVGGRSLRFTSLDKVLYPSAGTTKREVLEYLEAIAPVMLPHLVNRPATRKRWPHGVGTAEAPGESFFQKNLDRSTPEWVARRTQQHQDHSNDYPLVNDLPTLLWLGQIGALEVHVPQWRFGDRHPLSPDRLVLDLDPGEGADISHCVMVAKLLRERLADRGFDPFPVTSGSKGIHLYAAADGSRTSDELTDLAHEVAEQLEAERPDLVVSNIRKAKREGRVFVDWSQNRASKTTVSPYSLRGRARPWVAAPRTWEELDDPDLKQLEFREVLERVERKGDLLANLP
ncbi:non-homologous end-joining DNA ligase [Ruicaihuangia caeni]|uniref:non-homologous end-joining DNA ligase n=1 Tax=Ruicaihuangia caeni TaxID=3042517 RepID=UPI0030EF06E9